MYLSAVNGRGSEPILFHKKWDVVGANLGTVSFMLNLVFPFHSQFGHVSRPEFVAHSQSIGILSDPY